MTEPWHGPSPAHVTSATSTVPRIPTTALGVRMSSDSPGTIRSWATATPTFPDWRSMNDRPGASLIVTADRSRIVTIDLPPSSTRASDRSPVLIVSWKKTSSLNLSEIGRGSAARRAVTLPSSVVTMPTFAGWPAASAGDNATRASIASVRRQSLRMFSPATPRRRRSLNAGRQNTLSVAARSIQR